MQSSSVSKASLGAAPSLAGPSASSPQDGLWFCRGDETGNVMLMEKYRPKPLRQPVRDGRTGRIERFEDAKAPPVLPKAVFSRPQTHFAFVRGEQGKDAKPPWLSYNMQKQIFLGLMLLAAFLFFVGSVSEHKQRSLHK